MFLFLIQVLTTRWHQDGTPTPAAYTTTASCNWTTLGPGIFFPHSFSIINVFFHFIGFNPAITRRRQDDTPTPPPSQAHTSTTTTSLSGWRRQFWTQREPEWRTLTATSRLGSKNWALCMFFIYLFNNLTNCLLHFRHNQLLYHCEPPHQGQVIFSPHVLSLFLFLSTN